MSEQQNENTLPQEDQHQSNVERDNINFQDPLSNSIQQQELDVDIEGESNNQHNNSFQAMDEFAQQNMLDFDDNMQILFGDDGSHLFQNFINQAYSDDNYFQNMIHNQNFNQEIPFAKKNDGQTDAQKQIEREQQENILAALNNQPQQNENSLSQSRKYKMSDSLSIQENQQTHKFSTKEIQEHILSNAELNKKYKQKIACPMCLKANLQMFEINQEESIYMCTYLDCTFPFENEDLAEYTFQTKYKKRIYTKIKNKIHFKYNPPIEVLFEEQDINAAIKELEQSN